VARGTVISDVVPCLVVIAVSLPFVVVSRASWMGAWSPTSTGFATSTLYAITVIAVVTGLRALWFSRSGLVDIVASSPRPRLRVECREVVDGLRGPVAGLGVVAVGMGVATAAQHPTGAPQVMGFVAVFTAAIGSGAVGYTATRLVPHVATPVVAGLAMVVIPYTIVVHAPSLTNLPTAFDTPVSFAPITTTVSALRATVFVALALLVIAALARRPLIAASGGLLVLIAAGMLARVPVDDTARVDSALSSVRCTTSGVRICVPAVHANEVPRLRRELLPLAPLLASRYPNGVVFEESSITGARAAADPDTVVFDFMAGPSPDASHFDRDRTLMALTAPVLGISRTCPTTVDDGSREGALTFAGEVERWYLHWLRIDLAGFPTYLQSVSPTARGAQTTAALATSSDADVLTWLQAPAVRRALATCGPAPSARP
jgi:hypothetical protein